MIFNQFTLPLEVPGLPGTSIIFTNKKHRTITILLRTFYGDRCADITYTQAKALAEALNEFIK